MSELAVYRTANGTELTLRPVSQVLIGRIKTDTEARMRREGVPIDPPTYTVKTATGETETHRHDESSLETDEDRAAWAAYQAAQAALSAEVNRTVTKVMLSRGVVCGGPPDGWADEMRGLGVELPDDPGDLLLDYLTIEVLVTPADVKEALIRITQLSMEGLPAEQIAAVEGLFRRPVAGRAVESAADREVGLDVSSDVGGDAGGA